MCQHRSANKDTERGKGEEKEKEASVVSTANTVANPGTVVIKVIDANIARRTVDGTGWTKEATRIAELELQRLPVNEHLLDF